MATRAAESLNKTDPVRIHTIELMMTAVGSKLIGTWKLVSASSVTATGEQNEPPYGANPVGFLTYTEDGWVSALISYGGREPLPVLSSGSDAQSLQEKQAEAFKTFFAYAGRYVLSGDNVTHNIEVSSIQNYVGKNLIRAIKFANERTNGDLITLVTPPSMVNGKIQIIELTWERLPTA